MSNRYFSSKQPYEAYFLGFDFEEDLGAETLSSAAVTCTLNSEDVTETATDDELQATDGSIVYLWFRAATVGTYHITCRINGSNGSKYEMDGYIRVAET